MGKMPKYGLEFKNNGKNIAINERLLWKGIGLRFFLY